MVTIDALKKSGVRLKLGRFACHPHLYVDPTLIAVPGGTPIPEISDLLICPQRRADNTKPGHPICRRHVRWGIGGVP